MYSPVRQVSQSPHSYRHDDNIYTSRSRHEHVMQRIQTFHHQYTNFITNRWGHFANLYKHKPRIPMKKQEACLRRKPHEHQLLGDKPLCSSSIKQKVGKRFRHLPTSYFINDVQSHFTLSVENKEGRWGGGRISRDKFSRHNFAMQRLEQE